MEDLVSLLVGALGIVGFFYFRKAKQEKSVAAELSLSKTQSESDVRMAKIEELKTEAKELEKKIAEGSKEEPAKFWGDFLDPDKKQ